MTKTRLALLCILLLAAGLRLAGLGENPPGLEHDEVANWLIDRQILAGEHRVYFTEAYGHEAGYHYLQAASVALLGDHWLALRLPSALLGMLGIAVAYVLARKLFGERVALIQAALLAITLWPLFYARLGLRAILLPLVAGLSAWFFWKGVVELDSLRRNVVLAGLAAGLSLYTYMAARAVPIIYLLFSIYLLAVEPGQIKWRWKRLLAFWLITLAVATPLWLFLAAHPGAEFRIGEIDQPLNALLAGNFRPVLENGLKLVGFFGWQGDPLLRQNWPGRPVFDPLGALLFYGGVALALWRWRQPRYAFVLLWLGVSLTPSLVTADAPSSIRCINALVVLGIFAGLAVEELAARIKQRPLALVAGVWLLGSLVWTGVDYWVRWPAEPEVQFVWQSALQQAAGEIEQLPAGTPVVVAGWTPESMDPPTMELYLQRDDLALRYIDPTEALVWPAAGGALIRPAVLPFDDSLAEYLSQHGVASRADGDTVLYWLPAAPEAFDAGELVALAGGIQFLGYQTWERAGELDLVSVWRVGGSYDRPLRVFLHLLDPAGEVVAQDDGLGAPSAYWQNGDLIFQVHHLEAAAGEYQAAIGVYDRDTNERLALQDDPAVDSILLDRIVLP